MTAPGFGTQPFGTSSFGWPARDVTVTVGPVRVRALTAAAPRVRTLTGRLVAS